MSKCILCRPCEEFAHYLDLYFVDIDYILIYVHFLSNLLSAVSRSVWQVLLYVSLHGVFIMMFHGWQE